jgi:hypothetical protein
MALPITYRQCCVLSRANQLSTIDRWLVVAGWRDQGQWQFRPCRNLKIFLYQHPPLSV